VINTTTHVWLALPYSLRWESTFSGDGIDEQTSIGGRTASASGRVSEVHTNEQRRTGGTMTTDEERLPDPSALLGVYRFATRYRPHPSEDQASKSSRVGGSASSSKKFGPLSDELSLLVDKELGVPLRSAVMVTGEEISSSEIVEIAFDEPIPAALFRPLR